jgi:hypothetical protein
MNEGHKKEPFFLTLHRLRFTAGCNVSAADCETLSKRSGNLIQSVR